MILYQLIHACGNYSDYLEETLGIFDSEQAALLAAKVFINRENAEYEAGTYGYRCDDSVELRTHVLNAVVFDGVSKADAMVLEKTMPGTLYQLDEHDMYVEVKR